jgi:type IV pilus assembly protein PilA
MRTTRARIIDESGFTLVEVLVVCLIVPILAGIAIPSFIGQKDKASDSTAKSAVRNAAVAIETFHADAGTYAGADRAALAKIEPSLNEVADTDMTVTPNDSVGYVLAVKQGENQFTITKASGVATRTCTVAGSGGCPAGGSW